MYIPLFYFLRGDILPPKLRCDKDPDKLEGSMDPCEKLSSSVMEFLEPFDPLEAKEALEAFKDTLEAYNSAVSSLSLDEEESMRMAANEALKLS